MQKRDFVEAGYRRVVLIHEVRTVACSGVCMFGEPRGGTNELSLRLVFVNDAV